MTTISTDCTIAAVEIALCDADNNMHTFRQQEEACAQASETGAVPRSKINQMKRWQLLTCSAHMVYSEFESTTEVVVQGLLPRSIGTRTGK